jgi:WD40 repeat protein
MQDVKYWRLDTGRCFKTLSGHTERVCALRFDQQILATASQDLTVRYRVPTTPIKLETVFTILTLADTHPTPLSRIWASASGEHLSTLTGHNGSIWCLDFADGVLVTGSADQSARVWDIETGKCVGSITGTSPPCRSPYDIPSR